MTYLSDKRNNNRSVARIVGAVLVLIVIIFWAQMKPIFAGVFFPIGTFFASSQSVVVTVPKTILSYFTTRNAYEEHIATLEETIERLENEKALNRVERDTPRSIMAFPMFADITGLYGTVRITRGFVDGVQEGDVVYVRGRYGIGTIESVNKETSLVALYSRDDSSVRAVIPESNTSLILQGAGGGSFTADVPKTITLREGTIVYLESDPTIALGVVVRIDDDPQDVAMRVYLRGMYNPQESMRMYIDNNE